jgi:hypothetical protein
MYKYKRIPMGICLSTDIAQEIMESVLQRIKHIKINSEFIRIFSKNFEDHLQAIQKY